MPRADFVHVTWSNTPPASRPRCVAGSRSGLSIRHGMDKATAWPPRHGYYLYGGLRRRPHRGWFQFPKPSPLSSASPPHIAQLHSGHHLIVIPCRPVQYWWWAAPIPAAKSPRISGTASGGVALTSVSAVLGGGRVDIGATGRCVGSDLPVEQTADQLPSPSTRFAANPQLSGKDGGQTLNLHEFARTGVVSLGRLGRCRRPPHHTRPRLTRKSGPKRIRPQRTSGTRWTRSSARPVWTSRFRARPGRRDSVGTLEARPPPRWICKLLALPP